MESYGQCEPLPSKAKLFCSRITRLARQHQWRDSLHLLHVMEVASLQPDIFHCNAALSALEKIGAWRKCLVQLQTMRICRRSPDTISFDSAISGCEKSRRWQVALQLMRGVPQVSCAQCEVTFNAAMSACEKMCAWRGGLQLFSELLCNNLQVDTIGFSVTISSLQRLGRWQPASKLLRDMPVWRIHRNTVGANAAIAACRGPDWPFTLDLLSWMPEAGMQPDRITMNSQISCSARGIQWISALHLFAHLGELGMRFNEVTLGAAAAALEDPGLWRMGAQLLTALTEGFRVEATTCFDASLRSCWKGGRPDLVLMLFDAMPRLRLPRDEVGFRTAVEASKEVASWRRSMG
ncbi:unnamed protein product, partial [Effrenium voratum]